jgi:hypothetical protein
MLPADYPNWPGHQPAMSFGLSTIFPQAIFQVGFAINQVCKKRI